MERHTVRVSWNDQLRDQVRFTRLVETGLGKCV